MANLTPVKIELLLRLAPVPVTKDDKTKDKDSVSSETKKSKDDALVKKKKSVKRTDRSSQKKSDPSTGARKVVPKESVAEEDDSSLVAMQNSATSKAADKSNSSTKCNSSQVSNQQVPSKMPGQKSIDADIEIDSLELTATPVVSTPLSSSSSSSFPATKPVDRTVVINDKNNNCITPKTVVRTGSKKVTSKEPVKGETAETTSVAEVTSSSNKKATSSGKNVSPNSSTTSSAIRKSSVDRKSSANSSNSNLSAVNRSSSVKRPSIGKLSIPAFLDNSNANASSTTAAASNGNGSPATPPSSARVGKLSDARRLFEKPRRQDSIEREKQERLIISNRVSDVKNRFERRSSVPNSSPLWRKAEPQSAEPIVPKSNDLEALEGHTMSKATVKTNENKDEKLNVHSTTMPVESVAPTPISTKAARSPPPASAPVQMQPTSPFLVKAKDNEMNDNAIHHKAPRLHKEGQSSSLTTELTPSLEGRRASVKQQQIKANGSIRPWSALGSHSISQNVAPNLHRTSMEIKLKPARTLSASGSAPISDFIPNKSGPSDGGVADNCSASESSSSISSSVSGTAPSTITFGTCASNPKMAPILRSYKKMTFTKDGATITETGKIVAHETPNGTITREIITQKSTKFEPHETGGSVSGVTSNGWQRTGSASSVRRSESTSSSGSIDLFDELFDTWTGDSLFNSMSNRFRNLLGGTGGSSGGSALLMSGRKLHGLGSAGNSRSSLAKRADSVERRVRDDQGPMPPSTIRTSRLHNEMSTEGESDTDSEEFGANGGLGLWKFLSPRMLSKHRQMFNSNWPNLDSMTPFELSSSNGHPMSTPPIGAGRRSRDSRPPSLLSTRRTGSRDSESSLGSGTYQRSSFANAGPLSANTSRTNSGHSLTSASTLANGLTTNGTMSTSLVGNLPTYSSSSSLFTRRADRSSSGTEPRVIRQVPIQHDADWANVATPANEGTSPGHTTPCNPGTTGPSNASGSSSLLDQLRNHGYRSVVMQRNNQRGKVEWHANSDRNVARLPPVPSSTTSSDSTCTTTAASSVADASSSSSSTATGPASTCTDDAANYSPNACKHAPSQFVDHCTNSDAVESANARSQIIQQVHQIRQLISQLNEPSDEELSIATTRQECKSSASTGRLPNHESKFAKFSDTCNRELPIGKVRHGYDDQTNISPPNGDNDNLNEKDKAVQGFKLGRELASKTANFARINSEPNDSAGQIDRDNSDWANLRILQLESGIRRRLVDSKRANTSSTNAVSRSRGGSLSLRNYSSNRESEEHTETNDKPPSSGSTASYLPPRYPSVAVVKGIERSRQSSLMSSTNGYSSTGSRPSSALGLAAFRDRDASALRRSVSRDLDSESNSTIAGDSRSSVAAESVQERILRKSFYSRFNQEQSKPTLRRKGSLSDYLDEFDTCLAQMNSGSRVSRASSIQARSLALNDDSGDRDLTGRSNSINRRNSFAYGSGSRNSSATRSSYNSNSSLSNSSLNGQRHSATASSFTTPTSRFDRDVLSSTARSATNRSSCALAQRRSSISSSYSSASANLVDSHLR